MDEIRKFDKAKAEVALHIENLKAIEVNSETSLAIAKTTIKAAIEAEKLIENKRVELVSPHLEAQRSINSYAKELTLPLQAQISEGKKQVLAYEQEKERIRLAELKKLEDDRKAKEVAERLEVERVEKLKHKLHLLANNTIAAIVKTTTIEEIDQVERSLKSYSVSETAFQEYQEQAARIKEQMLQKVSDHKKYLEEKIAQEAEAKRLSGIEKQQADLRIAQEEEARKLSQESERIERESRALEQKKLDDKLESERKIKEQADQAEFVARQKALEAEKSKSIRKDWGFDIINVSLLPREFLIPDEAMIKDAIKKGVREIPGVMIFQKDVAVIR